MKRNRLLFTIICIISFVQLSNAQLNIGGIPLSFTTASKSLKEDVPFVKTAILDMQAIEEEDIINDNAYPKKTGKRFGIEHNVNYNFNNSGVWSNLPDSSKIWRLGIECPDAVSINLIFDKYLLPEGATLYIYGEDKEDLIGGFTEENNQDDGYFATTLVFNNKIIIEYFEPADAEFSGQLNLSGIIHGYRGMGEAYQKDSKSFKDSGSCQVNVKCPTGEGWEDQIRSVFAIVEGGTELCSGAMINNTKQDGKPYALTANHCYEDGRGNPSIWVFRFNWESPTCATPSTNPSFQTMSGATLKARSKSTDFCLVELNQTIPEDYNVYYAGWSRSTTPSSSAMCIHHPSIDIKKISPSYALYTVELYGVKGWRADWSTAACTEGGSSGSPLFDSNKRIVGQEYGGDSYCNAPQNKMFDVFGRFDLSWNGGGSSSNRLKDWLDPLGSSPETLDGFEPSIYDIDAELNNIISPEDVNYGETITPKFTIKNKGKTTLTSASLAYQIDNGQTQTKQWTGNLTTNNTENITFDEINLSLGTHTIVATLTVDNDENTEDNSIVKNFEVKESPTCAKIIDLDYEISGSFVVLKWTAPNDFVKSYKIYRNSGLIAEINGSATSCNILNSSMTNYEYCVIAVYELGFCTESEPACINFVDVDENLADNICIYPNPANSQLSIEGINIGKLEIYSVKGNLIETKECDSKNNNIKIDVSNYAQGSYIIKVYNTEGKFITKQINIAH